MRFLGVSRLEKRLKIVPSSPFFLPPLALASPLGLLLARARDFSQYPPNKELAGMQERLIPLLIRIAHVGGKRGPEVNLTSGCRRP